MLAPLTAVLRNNDYQDYSQTGISMVEAITEEMEGLQENLFTPLHGEDFQTHMSLAHVNGDNFGYLRASATVHTSIEECCAFQFVNSRRSEKEKDVPEILLSEVKQISSHSMTRSSVRNMGWGLSPRWFLTRHVVKRMR